MKNKFIIPAVIGIVCLIIGFFIGDSTAIKRVNKEFANMTKAVSTDEKTKEATKEEQKDEGQQKDVPPVTLEEIPYNITMLEPNSIGARYMEMTYTNNSKVPIKGINMTVLLKDINEKTYLSNYDTIMPGETSPVFESFAPKSGDQKDIEILKIEITTVNDDGSNTYIDYDAKLKTYEWF